MLKFLKSKVFLFLEIIILILIVISLMKILSKKKSVGQEIDYLSRQIAVLQQESDMLTDQLQDTFNDSYAELEAKRKLNYRRPNETVFVFYEDKPVIEAAVKDQTGDHFAVASGNPGKWWRYFFGN